MQLLTMELRTQLTSKKCQPRNPIVWARFFEQGDGWVGYQAYYVYGGKDVTTEDGSTDFMFAGWRVQGLNSWPDSFLLSRVDRSSMDRDWIFEPTRLCKVLELELERIVRLRRSVRG